MSPRHRVAPPVALALVWPLVATLVGCASTSQPSPSWGPVPVDPPALAPGVALEATVSGDASGDLGPALRAAVAEARLGTHSTSTFTMSVSAREHVVGRQRAHVAELRFVIARDGARVAEDEVTGAGTTQAEARRQALARLLVRAEAALARQDETRRAAPGRELPAVVVVERIAHSRDLLELSFVETLTGAVLRREIVPLADAAAGPPGRFLLSRRTVEGQRLDDEAYASLVKRSGTFLDLRPVGDAHRMGYFGPRAIARERSATVTPASDAPPPRTPTPPRR